MVCGTIPRPTTLPAIEPPVTLSTSALFESLMAPLMRPAD